MAAAVLLAALPSHRVDTTNAHVQPEATAQAETLIIPARLDMKKTVVSKAPTTAAVARTNSADGSREQTPAVDSVKTVAVESMPRPAIQSLPPVTITGCLEHDEETFWLKNTSGVDAPKSRGWRSGFLKRGPSPVELVDATNTLKLPNYVGQRVAATGMLTNGEMRVSALQRVAAFCS